MPEAMVGALAPDRKERVVLATGDRRKALFDVIRSARERLILSVFRCDDFRVLDELADALQRKVHVEALVTSRAKGWDKRLDELEVFLDSMGAEVHRYASEEVKYHAKYVVADSHTALVASLNLTLKCFDQTSDFIAITHDGEVIAGLIRLFENDCRSPHVALGDGLPERLVIGPERAREQIAALLRRARRSIRIIDHRVEDEGIISLLKERQAAGVKVEILGRGKVDGLISHGKIILVDGETAQIGSISLSPPSLNTRREVALQMREPECVGQLNDFFQRALKDAELLELPV